MTELMSYLSLLFGEYPQLSFLKYIFIGVFILVFVDAILNLILGLLGSLFKGR